MSYEDGMIHRCDITLLSGTSKGLRGGANPAQGATTPTTNVPCRLTTPRPREVDAYAKRGVNIDGKVMFLDGVRLTNENQLVFTEPATNRVRIFQVRGAYSPHEMGRFYIALCQEVES